MPGGKSVDQRTAYMKDPERSQYKHAKKRKYLGGRLYETG